MEIDGIKVEIMEFESLRELLKPSNTHYILKYELNEEEAIYYAVYDGQNFVCFAFCIDKNFKHENIRIEGNGVCDSLESTGTTIVTANVIGDSFLEQIFEYLYPSEKEKKAKSKKT